MKRQNGNIQNICRDPRSTKRVMNKLAQVYADSDNVLFHDAAVEELKIWCRKPEVVDEAISYLNGLRDADGPFCRSIGRKSSMLETIDQFTLPQASDFRWNRHYQKSKQKVLAKYPKTLTPLTYHNDDDIDKVISDWTTSAGWTGVCNGKPKKADNREDVFITWSETANKAIKDGSFNCPVIPGSRTQASGEFEDDGTTTGSFKRKKRPIWMTDMYQLITEQMFGWVLTQWIKNYDGSAIGKDDDWIERWVFNMRNKNSRFISLDYSKYDSSIPSWLIYDAFEIIHACFPGMSEWHENLFAIVREDFIHKNVLLEDGSMLYIDHGNPSGSGFTALVNGICNELITETWCSAFGFEVNYNIMGDDNLMFTGSDIKIEEIASYILHNFGVKVNVDKTNYGTTDTYPEYLSRLWTSMGPYRHPNVLISKIAFPERWRHTPTRREVQLVIYSYILGYRAGMSELLDVSSFLTMTGLSLNKLHADSRVIKNLPWNVRTYLEHKGKI